MNVNPGRVLGNDRVIIKRLLADVNKGMVQIRLGRAASPRLGIILAHVLGANGHITVAAIGFHHGQAKLFP